MQNKAASYLNLPVSIHTKTIEDWANTLLPEVLYEDQEANDDGLLLVAKKMGSIEMRIEDGKINYSIPLAIWLKKLTMLSDVEIRAAIRVEIETRYSFPEIDLIHTQTELKDYQWIQKPKAALAGFNLSVERLANYIIKRSQTQLVELIDQQFQEEFQIRKLLAQAWARSEQALPLYSPLSVWLLLQPQGLSLSALKVTGEYLQTQLRLEAQPKVYAGHLPAGQKLTEEPVVHSLNEEKEEFEIYADGEMTLSALEQAARQQLTGQDFSFAGYEVAIKKLSVRGDENRLIVHLDFSGSYDGWARVSGIPTFNPQTQVLSFNNIQYALDKSNPLVSGLGWLFKRTFERKLREALTIKLEAPMNALKQLTQDQLKNLSFHPTVKLGGEISTIEILSARYSSETIFLKMYATGALRLRDQRRV